LEPDLITQVKRVIVDGLHLDHLSPDQIDDDLPLFGDALGLDSVDALELVLEVERHFAVTIEDDEQGRAVLQTARTLADYIAACKAS
jgi:acyl carrier protein